MVNQLKDPDAVPPDVRFRRASSCRWEYGRFVSKDDHGDVNLVADKNGASRTVFAAKAEFKTKGPRGGDDWVPAEQAERPMVPS